MLLYRCFYIALKRESLSLENHVAIKDDVWVGGIYFRIIEVRIFSSKMTKISVLRRLVYLKDDWFYLPQSSQSIQNEL